MAYSSYGSFADLLRQAKTQSQLRGTNLSPTDIKSMGSGYFSEALDQTNTDRANALAESSQALAEKSQTANEENFAKSYALSNDQFARTLAQSKEEAAAQQEAAAKAQTQGGIGNVVSAVGAGALLAKEAGLWGAKAVAPTVAGYASKIGAVSQLSGGAATSTATGVGTGSTVGTTGATAGTVAGTLGKAGIIAAAAITAAKYGMPVLGKTLGAQPKEEYNKEPSSSIPTQAANITSYEWDRPVEAAGQALNLPVPAENTVAANLLNPGAKLLSDLGVKGTWVCTEIAKRDGITKDEEKALSKLRRFAIKNHRVWAEKYLKEGHRLVEKMNTKKKIDGKYNELKNSLVREVCYLVRNKNMEEAYGKYKEIILNLCQEYEVEV